MNTFVTAIDNQEAFTTNGMKACVATANSCVDLFYAIGASRGKDIIPQFTAAYVENPDLALRIVAWARDVRGGAGEREIFRSVLRHLETRDPKAALALLVKVPELGRWDDIFVFKTPSMKVAAYNMLKDALAAKNGLAAKWTPRKGDIAFELRAFFNMSPKQYRKTIVSLTHVVEQQMCANDWDNINYSHVPSIAHAKYKKAFLRHGTTYLEYVKKLASGDKSVKINASAIFPHDVIKGLPTTSSVQPLSKEELDVVTAQWDALPNYVGNASVLPLVDVSGSMTCALGGAKSAVSCLDVAVGLGLYFADKNTGAFKDCILTFTEAPQLMNLRGNIVDKLNQLVNANWGMNTNLHAAFNQILNTAVKNKVAPTDMPGTLLILSDMQFDACVKHGDSAIEMIRRKYEIAGYKVPNVVFWNLNAHSNVPVKFDESGTALVSGFSPAIMTAIMSGDKEYLTPEAVMLRAVMQDRYTVL